MPRFNWHSGRGRIGVVGEFRNIHKFRLIKKKTNITNGSEKLKINELPGSLLNGSRVNI